MALSVGTQAPQFSLFDVERKERSLSEFSGKKVILAFYPGAFTGVCQKELCNFRDSLVELEKMNAQVLGISVDSPFANKAFADQNKITFPLLSDYTRKVSEQYGGVHQDFVGLKGYSVSKRAVYVVNEKGNIIYTWVSENPGVEPPYEEIKKVCQ